MARQPIEYNTIAPMSRSAVGVDTYVQTYPDPNAGRGFQDLAKALGFAAESFADKDAARQKEYESNIQYYANQFAQDRDIGLVDATQVGKAYPEASPIVNGKITELVGKRWAEDYVRTQFDTFLQDDAKRLDPTARAEFFAGLRSEIGEKIAGRPFFGNGAISAMESVINEYEGSFQREAAKFHQELQEEQLGKDITSALKQEPLALTSDPSINDLTGTYSSQWNFGNLKGNSLVIHHTGGRGTVEGVVSTFKARGYPAHYIIDRQGKIHQVLRDDQRGQHTRNSEINDVSNGNSWGVEIIARDDDDVTQAQILAAERLAKRLHKQYGMPMDRIYGHGEINSHKLPTEGQKVVKYLRSKKGKTPIALLDVISKGESGGNYNAYYKHGDNQKVRFTEMTVDEVLDWQSKKIAAGETQSAAVGRYQIVQKTLRGLKGMLKLKGDEKFTPELQDVMGVKLLEHRGLKEFQSGKISKEDFANQLAQEWAALPVVTGKKAGLSYYHGDKAGNRANIPVETVMAALDGEYQTPPDPVSQVDAVAGQYTSINPIRRRELIVGSAIDLALSERDTSILDRIPQTMRGIPDVEARITKAQQQIRDLAWQDYTRQNQIETVERERQNRIVRQEILDKLAEGERIDPAEYTKFGDNVYDFAIKVQNDEFVDPLASAAKVAKIKDNLLQYATSGSFTTSSGKVLKDIDPNTLISSVQEAEGITVQDKKKLISELPTLMEGVNLLNDPQVSSFYTSRIGADIQIQLQSAGGSLAKLQGNNIAGTVRRVFDDSLRAYVRASIEDGEGIPRGFRLIELMERAEEKALKKLETLTSRKTEAQESQSKPQQPSSKTTDLTSEEEDLLNKYLKANKDK